RTACARVSSVVDGSTSHPGSLSQPTWYVSGPLLCHGSIVGLWPHQGHGSSSKLGSMRMFLSFLSNMRRACCADFAATHPDHSFQTYTCVHQRCPGGICN